MLRGTFVFWQVYNSADQGQAIIASYHLEQLPAVLIVDPVTGAKVWERYGFISSDTLIEELVPFMDAGKKICLVVRVLQDLSGEDQFNILMMRPAP
eukprot:gene9688-9846_t